MAKFNRVEMSNPGVNTKITPLFMSLKEFSLAMNLSESTVRRRVKDGTYKPIQPGGKRHRILLPITAIEEAAHPDFYHSPGLEHLPSSRPKSGPKPKWQKD